MKLFVMKEFILMSEIQDDFEEIKISKKSDEELIEESDEELIEIKSPKKMKIQQIGMIKISSKKY